MTTLVWGLLIARWFTPTEGTAAGDTLWLTALTLATASGIAWAMHRFEVTWQRPDRLDVAVWLFSGAHIISALSVIMTSGDKRAATNMLWEWLSVAATYSLVRLAMTRHSRPGLLRLLTMTIVALSCYGIWQPLVWYPSNLSDYEALIAEYEEVQAATAEPSASPDAQRRLRELQGQIISQGIPLSGPQRELFERRLRDSKEPLGFFALTNTFAGILAIGAVLLSGALLRFLLSTDGKDPGEGSTGRESIRKHKGHLTIWGAGLSLVVYCLFLTKSRSAWGGAVAGLAALAVAELLVSRRSAGLRRFMPYFVGACLIVALLGGIAAATGALDIEVISEAPKSFQYRIEYWTGSWQVILDHPLLGTGPGNFRDHYLKHKLPYSSEEIADPHQFVLDVTANAGITGLLALIWLLVVICQSAWRTLTPAESEGANSPTQKPIDDSSPSHDSSLIVGGGLVVAGDWFFEGSLEIRVLVITLLAITLYKLASRLSPIRAGSQNKDEIPQTAIVAAGITLLIHLLAAGGIAMPAVTQTLLVLAACLNTGQPSRTQKPESTTVRPPEWQLLAASLALAAAAVGCTLTAFVPVIESRALVQLANYEAVRGESSAQTIRDYQTAAECDALSPEPPIRLAEYYFRQWQLTRDEATFEKSIASAEEAIRRSPFTPQFKYQPGKTWLTRADSSSGTERITAAEQACHWLEKALAGYPTNPQWNAELAVAAKAAGRSEDSQLAARKAIELDDMNRNAGHIDRYLADDLRERLQKGLE